MNNFIAQHPEIAITLLSLMVGIIGSLLALLVVLLRSAINNMINKLEDFGENLGKLLDRMQRQETICKETRKRCPSILCVNSDNDGGYKTK